jgi:hypothetical protein
MKEIREMADTIKKNIVLTALTTLLFAAMLFALSLPAHAQKAGFGGNQLRCYEKCQSACGPGVTEAAFKRCVNANNIQWGKGCKYGKTYGKDIKLWRPFYGVKDPAALKTTIRGKKVLVYRCTENQKGYGRTPFKSPRKLCGEYFHLVIHPAHQRCLKNIPVCKKKC